MTLDEVHTYNKCYASSKEAPATGACFIRFKIISSNCTQLIKRNAIFNRPGADRFYCS
jgi:hypothetical protein